MPRRLVSPIELKFHDSMKVSPKVACGLFRARLLVAVPAASVCLRIFQMNYHHGPFIVLLEAAARGGWARIPALCSPHVFPQT